MLDALRALALWLAIAATTVAYFCLAFTVWLLTLPLDRTRRLSHLCASQWGRALVRVNPFWTMEVQGAARIPTGRPLVVVANHESLADIMALYHLPVHFKWIAKRSVFFVPLLGWFMFLAGYIPLLRGDRESIARCMQRARGWLERGVSVAFFPEGTRSRDGHVGPFKQGAFRLALETGIDLLPISISGTARVLPKGGFRFTDATAMQLLVHDPIPVAGLTEAQLPALVARTRDVIVAGKRALDDQARRAPRAVPGVRVGAGRA